MYIGLVRILVTARFGCCCGGPSDKNPRSYTLAHAANLAYLFNLGSISARCEPGVSIQLREYGASLRDIQSIFL